ncbi:MAG: ribonuclease T2 [Alphaproteobacteria bacterium]
MRMRVIAAFVASLFCLCAQDALGRQDGDGAGNFDYYVLSLSWSPTFCGRHRSNPQCSTPRGFVEHGLWPQYEAGGYPQSCGTATPVPDPVIRKMLPLMPTRDLITHEWAKHGTCSGMSANDYFAMAATAYRNVNVPAPLRTPSRLDASADTVRSMFVGANPGLPAAGVAVVCKGGEVSEVRLCLSKDLSYRACGRDVTDQCGGTRVRR